VILKGLGAKTNWLAVNCKSQSNSDSLVVELLRELQSSCCELLLWEAGSWGHGQFWNPEVRRKSALGSRYQVTLVETNRLRTLDSVWQWFVKCSYELCAKNSINSITNPNPVHSHSIHVKILLLYSLPNIIMIIKWRRLIWTEHGKYDTRIQNFSRKRQDQ
jgi:hypothetical protein